MKQLLLALCLLGPGCAHARTPEAVEDALAFAAMDRAKAIHLLEEAVGAARDKDQPTVMVYLGEQQRLAGKLEEARDTWTSVMRDHPRAKAGDGARLGLAVLEGAATRGPLPSPVRAVFDDVNVREAPETLRSEMQRLLLVEAARQNNAPELRRTGELARELAQGDPVQVKRVEDTLEGLSKVQEAPESWQGIDEPPGPPVSPLQEAWALLADGKNDQVAERVASMSFPADSPEAAEAAALLELSRVTGPVRTDTIGVLLPLSGKYAPAGKQVKEALELGYGDSAPRKRKLVFVDSGTTAETAVAALERLVLEDRVVGVIGPLLTDTSEPVAKAAQAFHVPLVALAQVPELTQDRDWVFGGMVNAAQQVEALLDHVMSEEVGMKSFAIFAPENSYGQVSAAQFRKQVEERGGAITVEKYYDPAATDIIPFAKELGRKDYEARSREFYDLKKLAGENGGNPDRVVLPPVMDFDALFVPDSATRLPIACAALAYEEFPIGEFQTSKDGGTVPLLGLSGYNDERLVAQGGPYVRQSIFVDAFFVGDAAVQDFLGSYREATGRSPSTLEATAWATGHLLATTADATVESRAGFRDAIVAAHLEEPTPVGVTHFDAEDREVDTAYQLLTISRSGIYPLGQVPAEDLPQR